MLGVPEFDDWVQWVEELVTRYGVETDIFAWQHVKKAAERDMCTHRVAPRAILESAIRGFQFREAEDLLRIRAVRNLVRTSGEDYYVASWILRDLPYAEVVEIFNLLFGTHVVSTEPTHG